MKWMDGVVRQCRVSADFTACIYPMARKKWGAAIDSEDFGGVVDIGIYASKSAAKEAVAEWVRKTMAQFGNALADSDEPRYYVTDAGRKALHEDNGA